MDELMGEEWKDVIEDIGYEDVDFQEYASDIQKHLESGGSLGTALAAVAYIENYHDVSQSTVAREFDVEKNPISVFVRKYDLYAKADII